MTDVEAIARGLSPRLKRAILEAEEIVRGEWSVKNDRDLYELALEGLADDLHGDFLNDLGLAVRAHLEQEQTK